jgi:hypothetical protein
VSAPRLLLKLLDRMIILVVYDDASDERGVSMNAGRIFLQVMR